MSNNGFLKVKKGINLTPQASAPADAVEGDLYFDEELGFQRYQNGSWGEVGSGAGQGELNLFANPSGAINVSDFFAGGTTTVTRLASGPLAQIAIESGVPQTGIRFNGGATDDGITGTFEVPEALANTKHKIEWYQEPESGAASGEWRLEVYEGATKLTVDQQDSSGDVLIPNNTGKSPQYTFTTGAAGQYSLYWVRESGSNHLDVTNIVVGPGIQAQGANVGPWTDYTPTISGLTGGYTIEAARWRPVGDSIDLEVFFLLTGTPTGTGNLSIALPTGLTMDSSYVTPASIPTTKSLWHDGSTTSYPATEPIPLSASVIGISKSASATRLTVADLAQNDRIRLIVRGLKVNELNATVNVANNTPEYASVGGTWDADSSTTVYGPSGSLTGGSISVTAGRLKTITWQTAVQPTDRVQVWASKDGVQFYPINEAEIGSGNTPVVRGLDSAGNVIAGVSVRAGAASNQSIVHFHRYVSMANDDTPAVDWPSANAYWVATKSKVGQAVGFALATQNSAGLVKAGQVPGTNTNDDAEAGKVGELIESEINSNTNAAATDTGLALRSITLTPGDWDIHGSAVLFRAAATFSTSMAVAVIDTTSGTTTPATITGKWSHYMRPDAASNGSQTTLHIGPTRVTVPANTTSTYYLNVAVGYSAGTPLWRGYLAARRVR